MESPNREQGHWARTVIPSNGKTVCRSPACRLNRLASKSMKQSSLNSQQRAPKCFIKITGSRYNGTFLLNIDNGLDDTIYHTMRDIEVALEEHVDPLGKPKVSPKNCLSSVFRCFGSNELQSSAVCNKKKTPKSGNQPARCSLTTAINNSNINPLFNTVQSNSFNVSSENSNKSVMRDVVDVFRSTLDQFHKESLSALHEAPSNLVLEQDIKKQAPDKNANKNDTSRRAKQSNEKQRNVSYIRFSQEEVLVIQPPKVSNGESKELEVGIEVKPKSTVSNVGQAIKLAKDKVLIGVQNGKGVLQIKDGIPKRSLQMIIEEGVNGKPLVKLSMNEKTPEQENDEFNDGIKNPETVKETRKDIYINPIYKVNESVSTCTISNRNTKNNLCNKLKSHKSVESQVSCTHLKQIGTTSQALNRDKFKSESTQYDWNASVELPPTSLRTFCYMESKPQTNDTNVTNRFSQVSQVTALDSPCFRDCSKNPKTRESRMNRMPYLVHTLYEPKSLNNSSAYFASNKPSAHNRLIDSSFISRKFGNCKRRIKEQKSFAFSSDYSSSSKCTKIFRDISEIGVTKPAGRKDASTNLLVEDLEKILQNMCGSSYLYHHPEPKNDSEIKHNEQILNGVKATSGNIMSFDQWTQTNNCSQKMWPVLQATKKGDSLGNESIQITEFGDGPLPKDARKKQKRTRSDASEIPNESSSTSGLEDGLSSVSSESNKQLVFSVFEALDSKPVAETSNQKADENCLHGKAESFVGQKIFAAIEDPVNHPTLLDGIRETDSFVYPDCRDASTVLLPGRNNLSVVNTALYDGPTVPLPHIRKDPGDVKMADPAPPAAQGIEIMKPFEFKEELNQRDKLQTSTYTRRAIPIRIKSRSCQNLSLTPSSSLVVKNVERKVIDRSRLKKLRYPQLTTTDSHQKSTLNVCGILNFKDGIMKSGDELENCEEFPPDCTLSSAIRSLLLPRQQSLIFSKDDQVTTYFCDPLTNPADHGEARFPNPTQNEWCVPIEPFESETPEVIRRSLFKRTFFAMNTLRTAVNRKFSSIFKKLSLAHLDKRKTNTALNDSVVYLAIPLKKKSENLTLYPRKK